MRAMKPLCSGINAGANARISPDLPHQQKPLTGRSLLCDGALRQAKRYRYEKALVGNG